MAKLVTGLFKSRVTAEAAVREISKWGYTRDDVSVLMSDSTKSREFGIEAGSKAAEGAGVGGAVGGAVGAVLAALVAVGTSIAVPGLGLVIAGPIAAALAGAGAGAAAGASSGCWSAQAFRSTALRFMTRDCVRAVSSSASKLSRMRTLTKLRKCLKA